MGTRTHVLDIARGGVHAYAMFPQVALQVFFVGLVVLDPLVVVLVGLVRREGIVAAGVVMVLDVVGNWWANWHWLRDDPSRLLRLLPLTLFGVFVVVMAPCLLRSVARTADRPAGVLPAG
ncbi:hypothetical protein ACGFS9_19780 [Streptomyces sp. NPDC048566]|uniref:hypothetical protein n=1 Tax=Streptomyces sp. NPDC048566 TaxID=3365569 RepID=UPI003722190B